jgi:transposase-like protein
MTASVTVTDGLKGIGEALAPVFPATTLQTCIVHLIRNSLDFASWKDRKQLAVALKPIYTAASAEAAAAELDAFEAGTWGSKLPTVVAAWRNWDRVIPFFAFPPQVRRVIYTTNAIESIHARLRKIIKTRGHFPSDDAATKLIWLALRNITADWGRAAKEWRDEPIRDRLRRPLYQDRRLTCGTDLPTASVVRRKRRPPPWISLRAPRTQKFRHSRSSQLTTAHNRDKCNGYAA